LSRSRQVAGCGCCLKNKLRFRTVASCTTLSRAFDPASTRSSSRPSFGIAREERVARCSRKAAQWPPGKPAPPNQHSRAGPAQACMGIECSKLAHAGPSTRLPGGPEATKLEALRGRPGASPHSPVVLATGETPPPAAIPAPDDPWADQPDACISPQQAGEGKSREGRPARRCHGVSPPKAPPALAGKPPDHRRVGQTAGGPPPSSNRQRTHTTRGQSTLPGNWASSPRIWEAPGQPGAFPRAT